MSGDGGRAANFAAASPLQRRYSAANTMHTLRQRNAAMAGIGISSGGRTPAAAAAVTATPSAGEPSRPAASGECELVLRLPMVSDVSLSPFGREVALATRQGALVSSLARSTEKAPHVQWRRAAGAALDPTVCRLSFSPHRAACRLLASASGRSVYVVDLEAGQTPGAKEQPPQAGLPGKAAAPSQGAPSGVVRVCFSNHLRPVNALDWNPNRPELLATCAEDCRLFIWDIRVKQPAQTLLAPASWTAAVRWSVLDEFLIATGHEDKVCVWETRKEQILMLAPGQKRVLGIDWSLHERRRLLSVSAQQSADSAVKGYVKVWEVDSKAHEYESIDICNGYPGAARFLPFGSAVLTAVDNTLTVFALRSPGEAPDSPGPPPEARVLQTLKGHSAPISVLDFAPRPPDLASTAAAASAGAAAVDAGAGIGATAAATTSLLRAWGDLRVISFSAGERCLRAWRVKAPEDLQASVVSRTLRVAPSIATRGGSAGISPSLGPAELPPPPNRGLVPPLPSMPAAAVDGSRPDGDAKYLGALALHQKELRTIKGVKEVTSYRQEVRGEPSEYQLHIEIRSKLNLTICVDPWTAAGGRRSAAPKNVGLGVATGNGVRYEVEWLSAFENSSDGPLGPGVLDETFSTVSLDNILSGGSDLCNAVRALVRLLYRQGQMPLVNPQRGDGAADSDAAVDNTDEAGGGSETPRGSERGGVSRLPFPRTCGVCWSPQGDLLCFRSLQNFKPPFPREWSADNYRRVLKIYNKEKEDKDRRTLLTGDDDKHTAAVAHGLRIDKKVETVPSAVLCGLVEDHWWAAVAPRFIFEPAIIGSTVEDAAKSAAATCRCNVETARSIGREDLAEVWHMASVICIGAADPTALCARPFAPRLVQQMIQQLFEAQETHTIAMLGAILLSVDESISAATGRRRPLPLRPLAGDVGQALSLPIHCRPRGKDAPEQPWTPPWRLPPRPSASDASAGAASWRPVGQHTWSPETMKAMASEYGAMPVVPSGPGSGPPSTRPSTAQQLPQHIEGDAHSICSAGATCSAEAVVAAAAPSAPIALGAVAILPAGSAGGSYPVIVVGRKHAPVIRRMPQPMAARPNPHDDLLELVPRDKSTMERLIHSTHAHCDLMHRFGLFRASRALAKVMYALREYHQLPILDVGDSRFAMGFPATTDPDWWARSVAAKRNMRRTRNSDSDSDSSSPAVPQREPLCGVCCLRMRGLRTPCVSCGHSYHMHCFRDWFIADPSTSPERSVCPTAGCECRCLRVRSAK